MALDTSDPKFQKAALVVLVVLAACYGYFSYIYGPKAEEMEKAQKELGSVEQQVTTARAIVQSADTLLLQNELSKRQQELVLVEALLPDNENLAILLPDGGEILRHPSVSRADAQRAGVLRDFRPRLFGQRPHRQGDGLRRRRQELRAGGAR